MADLFVFDPNEFIPIDELNKAEMLDWLMENYHIMSDPNYEGRFKSTRNRVFGTMRDDIDEFRDVLGRFIVTLQEKSLISI